MYLEVSTIQLGLPKVVTFLLHLPSLSILYSYCLSDSLNRPVAHGDIRKCVHQTDFQLSLLRKFAFSRSMTSRGLRHVPGLEQRTD